MKKLALAVFSALCLGASVPSTVPVTVSWDSVPEASSYDVLIGYGPRAYFRRVSTTNTMCELALQPGVTNYLAVITVTATNGQSPYSLELYYSAGKWVAPAKSLRPL